MKRREYEVARLRLARMRARGGDALATALAQACEVAAATLEVERVGIWLFVERRNAIRCSHLFERSAKAHSEGMVLRAIDIPTYFRALEEHRYICAADARNDPLTSELREQYLEPLGITSMLDAPIYRAGEVMGVVCHEHVGEPRTWTTEEQYFAGSVADSIGALAEEASRRDAEETVSALLEQALELEKMKGVSQLAAGAAHDVRNLVCAMRLAAGSIAEDRNATPGIAANAARIVDASESAMSIARDLETLGPHAERASEVLAPYAELKRLLPVLRTAAGENHRVELTTDGSAARVFVDRVQLDRLVLNLVLNARDAMPAGGTITIDLSQATLANGSVEPGIYVVLAVKDSGVGMLPDVVQRVFEPYFTTKPAGMATGLGLTVVYAIADRFGGFVHVESAPGDGTTFRVYFPRITAGAEQGRAD